MLCSLVVSPVTLAITPPDLESFKQSQIFSNWLLNLCEGKVATEKAFTNDAFKSASAWLEASNLTVEAFNAGDHLINDYLKMNITGSIAGNFNMLKCTLLSQSEDAKAIYNKYKK
jgi:hypothetical protein